MTVGRPMTAGTAQQAAALAPLATLILAIVVAGCAARPAGVPAQPGSSDQASATAGALRSPTAPGRTPSDSPLAGLGQAQVQEMLGPAGFQRDDGPARLLQYRNDTCVLDVFLYRDEADRLFRVAHAEARRPDLQPAVERDCLQLLSRGRGRQSSR